jgi:hypothetical protein
MFDWIDDLFRLAVILLVVMTMFALPVLVGVTWPSSSEKADNCVETNGGGNEHE